MSVEPGAPFPHFSFRAAFYSIGLCRRGSVELRANLAAYPVGPGTLVLMGPEVVRRWENQSAGLLRPGVIFYGAVFYPG
ncbi:MAG: AraC family ligand binding domain-containing protein [Hymenobacter sp.]